MADKNENVKKYLFTNKNLIRNNGLFILVSAACLFLATVMFAGNKTMELILYAIAIAVSGHEIAINAFEKLLSKKLSVELIITASVLVIFAVNSYVEAVIVTLLYSLSSVVTLLIRGAIYKKYCDINNFSITVKTLDENNNITEKPVNDLKPGETVLVGSNDEFLFDGIILADNKKVAAGEVNTAEGDVAVKVIAAYDCELNFEQFFENDKSVSKLQALTVNIMSYFTPIAIAIAFLTIAIPFAMGLPFKIWLYRAAIVLLIANPVAIRSLIQTNMILVLSKLKNKGISINNSKQLELFSKLKHLVINKSGVLTKNEYSVAEVYASEGYTSEQVLAIANMAQYGIDNSVARAIKSAVNSETAQIDNTFIQNKGITFDYKGRSVLCGSLKLMQENGVDVSALPQVSVYVAINNIAIGAIKLSNTLKSDSVKAVRLLMNNGVDCTLVTADNENIASIISEKCGFKHSFCQCDDHKKAKIVTTLSKDKCCGFIGSDNESLSCFEAAGVAVSMPKRQDVENSIDNDKLSSVNHLISISKKLFMILSVMCVAAVLVFTAMIALAIMGKIPMMIAAVVSIAFSCGWMYFILTSIKEKADSEQK